MARRRESRGVPPLVVVVALVAMFLFGRFSQPIPACVTPRGVNDTTECVYDRAVYLRGELVAS